jgi:Fic family protein
LVPLFILRYWNLLHLLWTNAVFDESQLDGSLQSLDDFKSAASELGIKVGKMKKDEIKDAIKATDIEFRFVFREDAIARLYEGKQILTPTMMLAIHSIQASISHHEGASRLLRHGMAEMSGFWTDHDSGIHCKCRPDWLVMADENHYRHSRCQNGADASVDAFARSVASLAMTCRPRFIRMVSKP